MERPPYPRPVPDDHDDDDHDHDHDHDGDDATAAPTGTARRAADLPAHVPVATLVRDGLVESVHHGSMAVVDADGTDLVVVGDVTSPVFPRSALKPLQAVAMVRCGLDVPADLLALATASHSGEPEHLARVRRLLAGAGVSTGALRTPPDLPFGEAERAAWTAAGRGPEPLAHNCSGKHAAMIATCRAAGWDTSAYLDPDHQLQRATVEVVEEFTGEPVTHRGTDGCGAPLFASSLRGLARAVARLGGAGPSTPEGRVADAVRTHPGLVGGRGRDVTDLLRAVPGLVAKDGAEAVQVAGTARGALALKVADGGQRARMPVTALGLTALGVDPALLAPFATVPVLGGGRVVGALSAVPLPPRAS